jgi:hypothetical protein
MKKIEYIYRESNIRKDNMLMVFIDKDSIYVILLETVE